MARLDGPMFRECKQTNQEHDRFLAKNRSLALAEELLDHPKQKKEWVREKTCFNCTLKKSCTKFRRSTIAIDGVASVGGERTQVCEKHKLEENRGMNNKQIKTLMKQFKRS